MSLISYSTTHSSHVLEITSFAKTLKSSINRFDIEKVLTQEFDSRSEPSDLSTI